MPITAVVFIKFHIPIQSRGSHRKVSMKYLDILVKLETETLLVDEIIMKYPFGSAT